MRLARPRPYSKCTEKNRSQYRCRRYGNHCKDNAAAFCGTSVRRSSYEGEQVVSSSCRRRKTVASLATIHTFDVPGDGWTIQHWRPDGMALDYVRRVNGTSNLWEHPLAGGPPKPLTRFSSGQVFDFSWSPDKSKLLLSKGSVTSDVVLITDER
jgi:hypothetical protein